MNQPGLPAYQRIAAAFRDQITSGALPPGRQLPTEHEIAREFDVARQTARNGLALLVAEGLIVARRPAGHFVVEREHMIYRPQDESRPQPPNPTMDRYGQQITAEGRVPSQKIEVALIEAPADIAERLEVPVGEVIVVRRRLRFINGEPVNTNDSHYPLDVVQGSEIMAPADVARGTNQVLADLGYPQTRATDQFFWRMPTPAEIHRLQLGRGTPIVIHYVTGYTADGRPVRCTVNLLPSNHTIVVERTFERAWQ
ncbi:GntR family transcriptional regulator [Polymorphospora sp. NPDC050346]|uniref:GntR family transcriptional regulator n=1 Tax=Polymorphospora sp. NPDC050346 TaxID=3155780 RepID=UPI0033D1BAB5